MSFKSKCVVQLPISNCPFAAVETNTASIPSASKEGEDMACHKLLREHKWNEKPGGGGSEG